MWGWTGLVCVWGAPGPLLGSRGSWRALPSLAGVTVLGQGPLRPRPFHRGMSGHGCMQKRCRGPRNLQSRKGKQAAEDPQALSGRRRHGEDRAVSVCRSEASSVLEGGRVVKSHRGTCVNEHRPDFVFLW